MNLFLKNITPVSFVCIAGIIFLLVQLFVSGKDNNILTYLIIYIILLAIVFAVDRFLVSKIAYKKLFIFELIFLVVGEVGYLYFNRINEINVETSRPYFFVIYDNDGIKKSEIPRKGLFGRSVVIKADSVVHVDKDLEYNSQIKPPPAWGAAYSFERTEAVINSEKITFAIFAKKMDYQKLIQLLEEEKRKLEN